MLSYRDRGTDVNEWVALNPAVAEGSAGANELAVAHSGKPGSPGAVGYRISVSTGE